MKTKKLLWLFFFICFTKTFELNAQNKKEPKYTKTELISFLKIYKYTLDHPFDPLVSLHNHYKKSTLSEERLTEILQSQFAGQPIKISEEEKKEMQKLSEFVKADQKEFNDQLEKVIIENNLTPKKYFEIEKEYNENEIFQRKVLKILKKKK